MTGGSTRRIGCGAAAALLLAVTTLAAGPLYNKLDYLTFSGPVALPGVTLPAGTYAFDVSHIDSGDVVRVRNRQTNRLAFMGQTLRVERPRNLPKDRHVVFGEQAAGVAPPILAWFPMDQATGYEFVYRTR